MIRRLLSAVRAAATPAAGIPADAPPPGRVVRVSDDAPAPAHMVVYSDAGRYRHSAISSACAVVSRRGAWAVSAECPRGYRRDVERLQGLMLTAMSHRGPQQVIERLGRRRAGVLAARWLAVVSDQQAGEAELSTVRGALALRAALRESDLLDIAADAGAGFDTPAEVRGL